MTEITKTIPVRISTACLVDLLMSALYKRAESRTAGEDVLFCALGYLVGVSDVRAVHAANCDARDKEQPTITVAQFRKWLPEMLSGVFAEWKRG